MIIKDLPDNEELLNSIKTDSVVTYEVWAICFDYDGEVSDELKLKDFTDFGAVTEYVDNLTVDKITYDAFNMSGYLGRCQLGDVEYISIEVVKECDVGEDGQGSVVYQRELWVERLDDEDEDYPEDQIVYLETGEYELLEDNTLKVNCFALKGFNKNDIVMFYFPKEEFPMEYKIMSKVIYEDGDYYHCELT